MFRENIEGSELNLNEPADLTPEKIPHKFWYKGENNRLSFDIKEYMEFLKHHGFAKVIQDKNLTFISMVDGILDEVEIAEIRDYIMKFVRSLKPSQLGDVKISQIERLIYKSNRKMFLPANLEFLPTIVPDVLRDTEVESFIPFTNGLLRITKDSRRLVPYSEFKKYIWKDHVIDREIAWTDEKSDFEEFCFNAMGRNEQRFNALRSVIGYLVNTFKNPANTRAVILMDEKVSDGSYGRSGKSLIYNAIFKIRKGTKDDGRSFKAGRNFAFQSLSRDTLVYALDDCRPNFPFEDFFSIIAEGITVEKKNKNPFYLAYSVSPKIMLTTNFTISGFSDSALARQFVVEFSDHYNRKHQPHHEFGKTFFDKWDVSEWNAFDNFIIDCVQYYLTNGLVEYVYVNLEYKRLVEGTSAEIVEFIECPGNFIFDTEYDKKTLHADFVRAFPDYEKLPQKTFTLWLKTYSKLKGYEFEERRSGNDRYVSIVKNEELPF